MSEPQSAYSRRAFLAATAGAVLAAPLAGCASNQRAVAPASRSVALLSIQSDADVERLLPHLSNWGRWGRQDQLGTLNFITPERRRAAANLVRTGQSVSLARQSVFSDIERGQHEVTLRPMGSRDFMGMVFHGFEMTHLDALAHVFADEVQMYNGLLRDVVTEAGADNLGVEVMGARGIVGRGVLLDVVSVKGGPLEPGTPIYPADLEAAEAVQGVRVGAGDLLFVRTGAGRMNTRERRAGLHPECLPWLHARQVALLGSDGDNDVAPLEGFQRWSSSMHAVAIPYLGMPLIDNADLETLHEACASAKRWAFLTTIAPLRVKGLTGSPVNPLVLL